MTVFSDKHFVFIISGGRTGTKYFGDVLSSLIPDAFSVHEPDVLTDFKIKSLQQIKLFGLYQLVFGKLTGKTGIRNLSQNYLSGKIDIDELKTAVSNHRRRYYESIAEDLIIESYSGWYGVIPAIRQMYKNYKIVVIVRDPRDWVTSNMNWGTMYGKRDWVDRLGLGRLEPRLLNDSGFIAQWPRFTRFQKLCWAWKSIYEIILQNISHDPNASVVKFEDVFHSKNRYEHLNRLIDRITAFSDRRFFYQIPEGILDQRKNINISSEFSSWENWLDAMKDYLDSICRDLAARFGYRLFATRSNVS